MEASIKKGFATSTGDSIGPSFLSEELFHRILYMEKRRAERSKKPFFLMLLNTKGLSESISYAEFLRSLEPALVLPRRGTQTSRGNMRKVNWIVGLPRRSQSFMFFGDVLWVSLAQVLAVFLLFGSPSLMFSDSQTIPGFLLVTCSPIR
jgi:hypothetical protein